MLVWPTLLRTWYLHFLQKVISYEMHIFIIHPGRLDRSISSVQDSALLKTVKWFLNIELEFHSDSLILQLLIQIVSIHWLWGNWHSQHVPWKYQGRIWLVIVTVRLLANQTSRLLWNLQKVGWKIELSHRMWSTSLAFTLMLVAFMLDLVQFDTFGRLEN